MAAVSFQDRRVTDDHRQHDGEALSTEHVFGRSAIDMGTAPKTA